MGDLAVTRSYEANRDLITSVENTLDTNTISRYDYVNDAAGRRITVKYNGTAFDPAGPTFYHYGYNTRSEVVSAERYFGSNTRLRVKLQAGTAYDLTNSVGLQDWSYAYDPPPLKLWRNQPAGIPAGCADPPAGHENHRGGGTDARPLAGRQKSRSKSSGIIIANAV